MQRLKCITVPLYGQEYSHQYHEFTFLDQHSGKKILYRKLTLDFKPPQDFLWLNLFPVILHINSLYKSYTHNI